MASYEPIFANLLIRDLHCRGYAGEVIIMAVLDTGVRSGYFAYQFRSVDYCGSED